MVANQAEPSFVEQFRSGSSTKPLEQLLRESGGAVEGFIGEQPDNFGTKLADVLRFGGTVLSALVPPVGAALNAASSLTDEFNPELQKFRRRKALGTQLLDSSLAAQAKEDEINADIFLEEQRQKGVSENLQTTIAGQESIAGLEAQLVSAENDKNFVKQLEIQEKLAVQRSKLSAQEAVQDVETGTALATVEEENAAQRLVLQFKLQSQLDAKNEEGALATQKEIGIFNAGLRRQENQVAFEQEQTSHKNIANLQRETLVLEKDLEAFNKENQTAQAGEVQKDLEAVRGLIDEQNIKLQGEIQLNIANAKAQIEGEIQRGQRDAQQVNDLALIAAREGINPGELDANTYSASQEILGSELIRENSIFIDSYAVADDNKKQFLLAGLVKSFITKKTADGSQFPVTREKLISTLRKALDSAVAESGLDVVEPDVSFFSPSEENLFRRINKDFNRGRQIEDFGKRLGSIADEDK